MEQNNELYHFGVPGMKWGVRKYQNEDGTLNTLGKKRNKNNKIDDKIAKKILKKSNRLSKKKSSALYAITAKTNAELGKSKAINDLTTFEQNVNKTGIYNQKKHTELYNKAVNDRVKIINKNKRAYADALIKECGYKNTKKGREYITNILDNYVDKRNK